MGQAQDNVLKVEPTLSYNSVTMKDMKSIVLDVKDQFPIDVQVVDDFPAYWGFGVEVTTNGEDGFSYGGIFHYNSSGSRLNVSDYSGAINYDFLVNRIVVGPVIRYIAPVSEKYGMGLSASAMSSFSNLKLAYSLNILGVNERASDRFKSISGQARISWIHRYNIIKSYYLIGQIGYELDIFSSKLKYQANSDAWLLNSDGSNTRLDWSGIRLQLGVGFNLPLVND